RWYNFRAWSFWSFQNRLAGGEIDIDVEDDQLAGELMGMEIKARASGIDNLLLESKEDMRKRGVKSPNRADAANYAAVDLTPWTGNPLNQYNVGDVITYDPWDMSEFYREGAGLPG